jgi:hypothetical protein
MIDTDNQEQDRNTQSFLLRLWRESPQTPWRIYVRDLHEDSSQVFADFNGLFRYLKLQVKPPSDANSARIEEADVE